MGVVELGAGNSKTTSNYQNGKNRQGLDDADDCISCTSFFNSFFSSSAFLFFSDARILRISSTAGFASSLS